MPTVLGDTAAKGHMGRSRQKKHRGKFTSNARRSLVASNTLRRDTDYIPHQQNRRFNVSSSKKSLQLNLQTIIRQIGSPVKVTTHQNVNKLKQSPKKSIRLIRRSYGLFQDTQKDFNAYQPDICSQRRKRREVLHALRKTGKRGQRKRRLTLASRLIKCTK